MCEGLKIQIGGEFAYDNRGESLFEPYKDLWKSDDKRRSMIKYGIANENLRKMLSKDHSAVTANKDEDVLMAKTYDTFKIKLEKILSHHGPYASYDMSDVKYLIKLPSAEKIMNAQTGEFVEFYKLIDMNLENDTIESEELTQSVKMNMKLVENWDTNTSLYWKH